MPIAVITDNPEGSQEFYEKVRAHMGLDAPAGGHVHIAGPSPKGGWRVLEVFDSREDAMRFRDERLKPAWQAIGADQAPPEPEIWEIHRIVK